MIVVNFIEPENGGNLFTWHGPDVVPVKGDEIGNEADVFEVTARRIHRFSNGSGYFSTVVNCFVKRL